ncbi:serine hydrolase domain-containing protein [Pseudoalteromonas denitrificans]|uniref:Beta-lactamase class C n=1 Tax=Pseudoalteromonas denitrificans DSM 6059 TaxID=1123010 RepID=A0A1I1EWJ8_9GAMM|nr:serine hydrolase domain-containing protein [Pseudoalteromonas denitrificans]SFB91569.1 beta-lactamase class C [Pseudoalteromonas denitrificans DSM 6059]
MQYIFALLIVTASFFAQSTTENWNKLTGSYVKHLKQALNKKSIPGAALSIVNTNYDSIALGVGQTKIKNGESITVNTRFRLASISKTFAGSLTSKLAEQGAFSLNDSVEKYLPNIKFSNFDESLKIYHLLSHSSGLVPNAYDNLIESRMNYPDIVNKLTSVMPLCIPGRCYGYQNVMFSLIGEITKKSTGVSYSDWLNKAIFKPLNMKNASIGFEAMVADKHYAHPHVKGRKRWHTAKLKKNYYKVEPAAGVNASASDMVQWLKAQLGSYPQILNDKTLKQQIFGYTKTKKELKRRIWREKLKQAHYGLGWRIYDYGGEQLYYHSGWVQGYRADIVVIPRLNIGFSLMLNAETGLINELTTDFIDRVLLEYKNKETA